MDPQIYQAIVEQEKGHWWFAARRAVARTLLRRLKLPAAARILDGGCGAGANLPLLAPFGQVHAFEMNESLRQCATARRIGQVEPGSLPDGIPFPDMQFDLITLFDVLEHIKDDCAALAALASRLKDNGALLLTVPAFQWLYGPQDRLHHHFRRYGRRELKQKLQEAGLRVEFLNYWNMLLFPVAAAVRLAERLRSDTGQAAGLRTPPSPVNHLLAAVVSVERFLVPIVPLPFGLSLIAVARKG